MSAPTGTVDRAAGSEAPEISGQLILSWRLLLSLVVVAMILIPPGLYRLPSPGLPVDMEPYRVFVFLMLLLWLVSLLTDSRTVIRSTGIDAAIVLVLVSVSLSFAVNLLETRPPDELAMALKAILYLTAPLALIYAINSVFRSRKDIEWALKGMVWLGVVIAVLGMIERVTQFNVFLHVHDVIPLLEYKPSIVSLDGVADLRRIAGPSQHAISFSVVLGMLLPVAIHYARAAKTWSARVAQYGAAGSIATTMLLTGSRTAFVAFTVLLVTMWWVIPGMRKWTVPGVVVLAIVIHFAFPGAIGMLTERLAPSYLVNGETGNRAGRVADYPRIFAEVRDRPLLGRGFGTFNPDRFFFVDNQYLMLAAEVGLLGIAVFLNFFVASFRLLFRTGRSIGGEIGDLAIALAASTAVFAVTTFTYDSFGFPQPFNLFLVLLGLGTALVSNLKEAGAGDQRQDNSSFTAGRTLLSAGRTTPLPGAEEHV